MHDCTVTHESGHICPMISEDRAKRLEEKLDRLLERQISHGEAIVGIKQTTDFYLGNGKDGKVVEDIKQLRTKMENISAVCYDRHLNVEQKVVLTKAQTDDELNKLRVQIEAPQQQVKSWRDQVKGAAYVVGAVIAGGGGYKLLARALHWIVS